MTVVAATPISGAEIDLGKAPFAVQTLSARDLDLAGPASVTGALIDRIASLNVNDDADDPFQPDIVYRGFTASPVLGTPEGLAVYQSGVRINEPFGDNVDWDLVPDAAVARIDVIGTDPVYGLNALGGAVVVTMKNGFDAPGGAFTGWGGAFGRRAAEANWGAHDRQLGFFVSVRGLDENGWRLNSADSVRQLYADGAWRGERLSLDLSFTGVDDALRGEGAAPVQELAVDRRLIFTSPQLNANRLGFLVLNADYTASAALSLQGNLFVRDLRSQVANGNTADDTPCDDGPNAGRLCQADGTTPLLSVGGGAIPDLSQGGLLPIGENDREQLHTLSAGGALQMTWRGAWLGHANLLSVGLQAEQARTQFAASAELGVIDPALVVQASGYVVSTPEGGAFTATPVSLRDDDTTAGAFVTDTLDVTRRLSVTASGRFNWVRIGLHDRLGESLSGVSRFARFNPALGATFSLADGLTAYAGYAEGSRAPTAGEIECSDPSAPCLLPSTLSADPPGLRQVVSRTWEAGLRGRRNVWRGSLSYSLGLYRARLTDDIYGVATSLSAGYFQNIPGTLRQGGEATLTYRDPRVLVYLAYAYVDATFAAPFLEPSPANPFRDGNGDISVRGGDRLPGIPRQRLKLGADVALTSRLRVGGAVQWLGSQYFRGDEANLLAPLPGYAVLNLRASYAPSRRLSLFVSVDNATNARYADYGLLGDPTGAGAPGVPQSSPADPRFESPGAPIDAVAGLTFTF